MTYKEIKIPARVILSVSLFIYCAYYLSNSVLPGNDLAHPEGWWGWYDQGEYIRSAKALVRGVFFWRDHQYPPFYAAMGALFLWIVPNHPFFFFNVVAFLVFVFVFERVARAFTSPIEAFALVVLGVLANYTVMSNFAIPWTTTGSALIYSATIYQLMRRSATTFRLKSNQREFWSAFGFSAIFGLEVICRPVDAGAAAIFFPAYLYLSYVAAKKSGTDSPIRPLTWQVVALGAGLLIGLSIFMAFNYALYGRVLGGYLESTAVYSGYFPFDIPRRAFSLIFDSVSIWEAPDSALIDKFPWIAISTVGMLAAIIRGHILLKVLAAAIIWQFGLYAAYGDLNPIGMWRWLNVHYFKWMFPYVALFAWLAIRWVAVDFASRQMRTGFIKLAVLALATSLVLGAKFHIKTFDVASLVKQEGKTTILVATDSRRLDFLDLRGMSGDFSQLYEGVHQLNVDGNVMKQGRDFRIFHAPWGARLLFSKTQRPKNIILTPDPRVQFAREGLGINGGAFRMGFGWPQWGREIESSEPAAVAAK